MEKLNQILFGPAGTGKTTEAIQIATKIVLDSNESLKEHSFNTLSNLPDLGIDSSNLQLIKDINNLKMSIKEIIERKDYEGYLKHIENKEDALKNYRAFPLIETVTFHPEYSYQDFIEGIATEPKNGQIHYVIRNGIFKMMCERARRNPEYRYVLLIDEINRGNISKIFGEAFTLIEEDKRLGQKNEMSVNLIYSKDSKNNPEKLTVPSNLYIVATMNTVDKSIAMIDIALRRRFSFTELLPRYDLFDNIQTEDGINIGKMLKAMNDRITLLKNEHYQIGHSYFLPKKYPLEKSISFSELKEVFIFNILPLLQEYFYDDWESVRSVLNHSEAIDDGMLIKLERNNLFSTSQDQFTKHRSGYKVNKDFSTNAVKNIYFETTQKRL